MVTNKTYPPRAIRLWNMCITMIHNPIPITGKRFASIVTMPYTYRYKERTKQK